MVKAPQYPMKSALPAAVAAATAILALAGMSAAKAQEANPDSVTIGYLNLVNAQLVTKNLGLMQKYMPGVDIEYIRIGGGGDMLRAIAADQVDFGGLGNPPTAIGITRQLPMKGIMVLNLLDFVEAMVVRESAGIASLADLQGKRIAAPFGSTTHYLLMQALTDEGIDPASMEILDLAPADIAVAWARGDIDAAWFWEPNLNTAVQDGGTILMHSGDMTARGYPTWDVGVVMDEFAEQYPDYVTRFIQAECEGIQYWIDNPEETAQIIAEELSLPLADASRMMQGTTVVPCDEQLTAPYLGTEGAIGEFADTLEVTAEFLVSQDRLPRALSREEFAAYLKPGYLASVVDNQD